MPFSPEQDTNVGNLKRSPNELFKERYQLRLFVAGDTLKSLKTIETIKAICEEYLPGRYMLEVVDIHQQPELAKLDQIIAVPTLIKTTPLPKRRMVGNFTNGQKVLSGLGLTTFSHEKSAS